MNLTSPEPAPQPAQAEPTQSPPANRASDFARGLAAYFGGAATLLRTPALWPYALAPFLLNGIVWTAIAWYGVAHFSEFSVWIAGWFSQEPGRALRIVIQILVGAILVLGGLLLFTVVGSVLAAPFNSLLSERAMRVLGAWRGEGSERLWKGAWRSIRDELAKFFCLAVVQLLLLPLHLVPLIGSAVHIGISLVFTALFLAYDYADYALEMYRWNFAAKRRYLMRHLGASLGFGTMVMLTLLVPFLGYFTMPIAVVGAAKLVAGLETGGGPGVPPTSAA